MTYDEVTAQLVRENRILRDALEMIAAQASGTPASISRADCMAAIAAASLRNVPQPCQCEVHRPSCGANCTRNAGG